MLAIIIYRGDIMVNTKPANIKKKELLESKDIDPSVITLLNQNNCLNSKSAKAILYRLGKTSLSEIKDYFASKIENTKDKNERRLYKNTLNLINCIEAHSIEKLEYTNKSGTTMKVHPDIINNIDQEEKFKFIYDGIERNIVAKNYHFSGIMNLIEKVKDIKHDGLLKRIECVDKIELLEAAFASIGVDSNHKKEIYGR